MSFTLLAPAYYQSLDKVRYLRDSAAQIGVNIWWYGVGKSYHDWYQVQVLDLIEELQKIPTEEFVYTDASDSILLGDLHEIDRKSWSPTLLFSVERSGRICAGGWMGFTDVALEALEKIRQLELPTRNPQLLWQHAIAEGIVDIREDTESEIFQVADEPLEVQYDRVYNPRTQHYPSILHFAGGYTDPIVGKAALMEPIWKDLGYE